MANIDQNFGESAWEDTDWMAELRPKISKKRTTKAEKKRERKREKQREDHMKAQAAINKLIASYNESCEFDTSSDWAKALMATDKMTELSKKTLGCQLSRNSDYTGIIGSLNIEGLDIESMDLDEMREPENQVKIKKAEEDMKSSLQHTDVSKVDFISSFGLFSMSASKENLVSILNSPFVKSLDFDFLLSHD